MRLIDADALMAQLKNLKASGGSKMYRKALDDALHYFFPKIISECPTITQPPNDPLTLEELREMDGEPVYSTKHICAVTGAPCCWCNPGPCDSRKPEDGMA